MTSALAPAVALSGKDLLEPRLATLCMNAGVDEDTMNKMGTAGMQTCAIIKGMATSLLDFREMLKEEPFVLDGKDIPTRIKVGKITAVYEACLVNQEVATKAEAERILANRPPEVPTEELEAAIALFEVKKFSLAKAMKPSKGFYERLLLQVETSFKVMLFTKVTNSLDDDDHNPEPAITVDPKGNFKSTIKDYSIAMPRNPLELIARFRTLAVGMYLLKMKYPGKAVLRTVEVEYIDRYVEWLYGPEVWGEATVDEHDRPTSTPTIIHVMSYDFHIREEVARLMNAGHDFAAAFDLARANEQLRTRHFTRPVSVAINTPESRACTAPNMRGHSSSSARPRALDDSGGITKAQINKIKQQAKAEAERDLKRKFGLSQTYGGGPSDGQLSARAKKKARQTANRTLALQNGGVGDGSDGGFPRLRNVQPPPPQHPGQRPDKGKGKGKGRDTHEGKAICYNWNRGAPCKQASCPMAHVCLLCKGDHMKKDHATATGI